MTPRALALAALIALALGAASTSCFVNRLSDDFACTVPGDCSGGRVCERGYCVEEPEEPPCPSQCTSCPGGRTCRIECSANRPCGDVHCPPGYECTIRCNNASACGAVDCAEGTGCDINCSGAASCGAISCGKAACEVDCVGALSCPSVDCVDSCRCDVRCNNPASACPAMSCPMRGLTLCTNDGIPGARCDSSEDDLCDSCPD